MPLFFGLNSYANQLTKKTTECKTTFTTFTLIVQASEGHSETSACPENDTKKVVEKKDNQQISDLNKSMVEHDMSSMVTDDKSFLQEMIPHHIEAINTSKVIVQSTKDTELKSFATNVVADQTKEVNTMKTWYKSISGSDYTDNATYKPMMINMNGKMDNDLDKAYISGMIQHHNGAIAMAKKILTISNLSEVKILAQNIITSQVKEVEVLNNWVKTTSITNTTPAQTKTTNMHSDGHSGH